MIRHALWLYFRFTLSLRDVEELLAERGIEVSYETIRCWHLDEMVVKVGGKRMWLWRAVEDEGEVLDGAVRQTLRVLASDVGCAKLYTGLGYNTTNPSHFEDRDDLRSRH